jgi:hypothetical protein
LSNAHIRADHEAILAPLYTVSPRSLLQTTWFDRWGPGLAAVAASACLWGIIVVSLPPASQDFPLVDDWAFGGGALALAAGEGVHYFGWAAMPLWGQWIWAQPFIRVLGQNHFALRFSTIVAGWLGVLAFYDLLRLQNISPGGAGLAALSFALCPLFFVLQGTFMSDVPALSFSLVALALYVRGLRARSLTILLVATIVSVAAATTRQNACVSSLTAAVLLWRDRELRQSAIWWGFICLPVIAAALAHIWLQSRADVTPAQILAPPPYMLVLLPFVVVHLFGLISLPVLALAPGRLLTRRYWLIVAALLFCAYYWASRPSRYFLYGGLFPYIDCTVTIFGAFSGELTAGVRPVILGLYWRLFLTVLGCLAGASWLMNAWDPRYRKKLQSPLVVFALFHLPFILIAPEFWDRYVLVLVPAGLLLALDRGAQSPVAPLTLPSPPRREKRGETSDPLGEEGRKTAEPPGQTASEAYGWRWALAVGLSVFMGMASLGVMHDWLAWNHARWTLGNRALDRDIKASDIEGGFEWDGWHARKQLKPLESVVQLLHFRDITTRRGLALQPTQKWFPEVTGRYALSFTELARHSTLDREPYTTWLPPGSHEFYLIEE